MLYYVLNYYSYQTVGTLFSFDTTSIRKNYSKYARHPNLIQGLFDPTFAKQEHDYPLKKPLENVKTDFISQTSEDEQTTIEKKSYSKYWQLQKIIDETIVWG